MSDQSLRRVIVVSSHALGVGIWLALCLTWSRWGLPRF